MSKNDMIKESNNLIIIVVLALFLILSLGYIAYDKYFIKLSERSDSKTVQKDNKKEVSTIKYNKDGYFIQNLMDSIVYKSGIDHREYQLYTKDKVTVDDLSDYYKDTIIHRVVGKDYFTTAELEKASKELFGKNVYGTYPQTLTAGCKQYALNGNQYNFDPNGGGCGGTGYTYYDMIKKVDSDENHIYVYQVVGFSCSEGICKDVKAGNEDYEFNTSNTVKKINHSDDVEMKDIADDLNTYKFTFTYDKTNNIYYFESVEKEK